jgi:signal transduction histidine kinase/DNA-binding LacI/PurR family transcriptional regulator
VVGTGAALPGPGRRGSADHRSRPVIGILQRELSGLYAEQWLGAVDSARTLGCDLICFTGRRLEDDGYKRQANVIFDLATEETLDGLVIWTTALGSLVGPQEMARFSRRFARLPVVSVEQPLGTAPMILMGDRRGMYAAVRHLIEVHGRRRIAFVRGAQEHAGAQERYQGYLDALADHGLEVPPGMVSHPTPYPHAVPAEVVRMVRAVDPPDAIAAAHDDFAVTVLSALAESGIRTPEDVSVVGFDDRDDLLPGGALESTREVGFDSAIDDQTRALRRKVDLNILSLTTVRAPFHELGRRAVEVLVDMLRGLPVPPVTVVDTELIVRRTCGCGPTAVRQASTSPRNAPVARSDGHALAGGGSEVSPHDAEARPPSTIRLRDALTHRSAALPADWPEQLSDSFLGELHGGSPEGFAALLDQYVHISLWSGEPVENWWQVLHALRQLTGPPPGDNTSAEDLWLHAQMLLNRAAERYWRYGTVLIERHNQIMREVGQQLITAPDVAELVDVLAGELPKLGVPSCYLASYEPVGNIADAAHKSPVDAGRPMPTRWSRLLLAYDNGVRREVPADMALFPSQRLVPGGQLVGRSTYSMVALPLYFGDQQLGFALVELGPRSSWLYPTLQEQLSTALHRVLLVERERATRAALEEAHRRAERQRLAAELHDSVSQALFSMTLQTRAAQLTLARQGGDPRGRLASRLAELQQLTAGALAEMRSLIFQLRPEALHDDGLLGAIRMHAAGVATREELDIKVQGPDGPLPLDERTEEELFRVVQEALHNSVKHAHPRRVEIRLFEPADAAGSLVVEVIDDGTGFDPDIPHPGHLGMRTMHERVERLGGRLIVESSPTTSTTIRAVLPGVLRRPVTPSPATIGPYPPAG